MDGNGKMADGYQPPDPGDRISLLQETFVKAMQENSLEKCAIVLSMSILTIHPYLDGNGRISRTLFALLVNGYSGSRDDQALFSAIGQPDNEDPENEHHPSGRYIIDLEPGVVKVGDYWLADAITGAMKKTALVNRLGANPTDCPIRVGLGGMLFDYRYDSESQLDEREQRELQDMFWSNALAFVACVNSFRDELYKQSLKHISFEGNEYNIIAYKNIIKVITKEDFINLKRAFRQARIDYVRTLMQITDREDFEDLYQQYISNLDAWRNQRQSN